MSDAMDRLIAKYPECRDREICASMETLEFYLNRRAEGMSHNFAAMLATQQFPGTKTEVMYFEGRHTLADQFQGNERQLEAVVSAARAKGYNPSPYDVYEPGLAEDIGDPMAFIKPSGGTTELKQKLEAAGKSAMGLVNVKRREPRQAPQNCPLADDIVRDLVDAKLRMDPDLARRVGDKRVSRRDLADQVRADHGYSDAKRAGSFTTNTPSTEAAVRRTRPVSRPGKKSKPRRKL